MKKCLLAFLPLLIFFNLATFSPLLAEQEEGGHQSTEQIEQATSDEHHDGTEGHDEEHAHHIPAGWSVIPFVTLLLLIATGPLFFEHVWHKFYPLIAFVLALFVVLYYVFFLHNTHHPIHALIEYVQFIALLTGLFVASGGILIEMDKKGTPGMNVVLLVIGAIVANVIGTTGASMLLVRPFIRLNKDRIKGYHIIFFIFMVSNVGGCLTPIGDPPLFLGFLKGIPFFWTVSHNVIPWAAAIILLSVLFYVIDKRNISKKEGVEDTYTGKISITGGFNFVWLALIIGAVFLDPSKIDWVPYIPFEGQKVSFVREIIMLSVAGFSFYFANEKALKGNEFNFEPIKEVAFIFIGIFGTMMPALELVDNFARSDAGSQLITTHTLYWATGSLSGVLDNAPTYLNFLAAAIASKGGEINDPSSVAAYAAGSGMFDGKGTVVHLAAISLAAVFFGAMTYIGNGPNFMVKAIAEQVGIKMPSFFAYVVKYSVPYLLPILFILWLVFFKFELMTPMFKALGIN